MKKILVTAILTLMLTVNACWFGYDTSRYIYLGRINSTVRVVSRGELIYLSGFSVSLPYSVGMLQNLPSDMDGITQAKLQYSVYRATSTADVADFLNGLYEFSDLSYKKLIPWQTVCTLGNGTDVLPMTSNEIINYFGSYRIRPNKSLVKKYDFIVIRVWMTDGLITSGDLSADLPPNLFLREATRSAEGSLANVGWHPNFAVCVVFNGVWGAR